MPICFGNQGPYIQKELRDFPFLIGDQDPFIWPIFLLQRTGPTKLNQEIDGFCRGTKIVNDNVCRMFYFFFESRKAKADPVVIWLTGGPGCSSELALFYENGPFKITNNMSLVWNDYGWDKVTFCFTALRNCTVQLTHLVCLTLTQVSNMLYVDQPTGTGFSYSSSGEDTRHDETGVSNDLYNFLQVCCLFLATPESAIPLLNLTL